MIEYAFKELKIPRLVVGADYENQRSTRLQKRLGFRVEDDANDGGYVAILENNLI